MLIIPTVSKYEGGGECLSFGAAGAEAIGMLDSTVSMDCDEGWWVRLRDDTKINFESSTRNFIKNLLLTFFVSRLYASLQPLDHDKYENDQSNDEHTVHVAVE